MLHQVCQLCYANIRVQFSLIHSSLLPPPVGKRKGTFFRCLFECINLIVYCFIKYFFVWSPLQKWVLTFKGFKCFMSCLAHLTIKRMVILSLLSIFLFCFVGIWFSFSQPMQKEVLFVQFPSNESVQLSTVHYFRRLAYLLHQWFLIFSLFKFYLLNNSDEVHDI